MNLPDSPLSLWLATYGPYTPEPALAGDVTVDVAVVGGGFAGLVTAYELRRADPALRVALLEHQVVGYGASGRNGSFGMTVVGLGFGTTALIKGKKFLQRAHRYMERAVDTMSELIQRERLECDYLRPGFLRAATTRSYVKRLQHEVKLMQGLGFTGIDWIDAATARARIDSPRYLGGMFEERLVLVNPAKLVREEKRLALAAGVQVYEQTPVVEITAKPKLRLKTPSGVVTTEKLVFATNAYSHLFAQLRRRQMPAFTYMIATEPLTPAQLDPIGWRGFEGVEDARNLIHYYRLTPDHRVVLGGGPVGLAYRSALAHDSDEDAWRHLEEHLRFLFPSLSDAKISHRWGGPFSVTMDLTPALGYLGDHRAVYSLGCIGHGVSMSHLNAQVLRDLVLERKTDLVASCPFVNRRLVPWPPEPLRIAVAGALRAYLRAEDWVNERDLRRAPRHAKGLTAGRLPGQA